MTTSSKKEKILVIESSASLADKLLTALKDDGYSVSIARDGEKGLEAISETKADLIILDLSISDMDAYELLQRKSELPTTGAADAPVILLSTKGETINMGAVPKGSPVDFVVSLKPDAADILERVNSHFGHTNTMTASSDKKTVLWVEDDKLISSILGRKFSGSQFSLIHANDGQEALKALQESKPDIIILDLMLPGMDGFEILQKIRMDDTYKKTPAIILSNLSKPSDFEKAKMLGVTKYLVKASASLDQIILEVATILGTLKK